MKKIKKTWRKLFFEIYFYPKRVKKYHRLWLWSKTALKERRADKHKRYRAKGYARLRNQKAKMYRFEEQMCRFCGKTEDLTIDHIKPVSLGGKNNIENLQILCMECNQLKGNNLTIK